MKTPGFQNWMAFADLAKRVLDIAIRERMTVTHPAGELRTGGWLCLMEDSPATEDAVWLMRKLGTVPATSRSRAFCEEKAVRIRRSGHISSWVDRDPAAQQYGGGVWFPDVNSIAALSGLPEGGDEGVVLVTGVLSRWATDSRAAEVIAVSRNEVFLPLLEISRRELASYQ